MTRRIALISEHASPLATLGGVDNGGQNVYVAEVARNLAAAGYLVDVFTRRDDPELEEVYQWDKGIRIINVTAGPAKYIQKEDMLPHMGQFIRFMVSFIQKNGLVYDLVHANFWMSGLAAAEVKRRLGIPFVITFHALGRVRRMHQGNKDAFPDQRFEIEDRIVREADRIIAECPQDQEDLLSLYNADAGRITIVPAGFDPKELEPIEKTAARKYLGLPEKEFIILQLGRLVPRKGVDNVIYGLSRLVHQHGVNAKLVIVGGESEAPDPHIAPELGRLLAITHSEGLADHVIFVGRRQRNVLKYYYSAADVFVSTPWYEPFGITPLEAMACGTPVVGADVGGIKYSVADGKTGFLVPPKDPDALGDRLAELYHNPQMRRRFGKQGILRVQKCFTWATVTRLLAEVYEDVIAEQQPAASPEAGYSKILDTGFQQVFEAFTRTRQKLSDSILTAGKMVSDTLLRGNKVLVCGNGGSAADAQHFAAELTGRFKQPVRQALPVIALNADPTFTTAWANDVSYDKVFSRLVEAFGQPGDLLIVLSTSGRSPNLVEACKAARARGVACLALLGKDGGPVARLAERSLIVPANDTAHIQEVQIFILHLICEMVEFEFRPKQAAQPLIKADLNKLETLLPLDGKPEAQPRRKVLNFKNGTNGENNKHEDTAWKNHSGNRRSPRIG